MIGVAGIAIDDEQTRLASDLRDARDLIVQLQRELERAHEVIEQQRSSVRRAFGLKGQGDR
jgi:hypothetical protein